MISKLVYLRVFIQLIDIGLQDYIGKIYVTFNVFIGDGNPCVKAKWTKGSLDNLVGM